MMELKVYNPQKTGFLKADRVELRRTQKLYSSLLQ